MVSRQNQNTAFELPVLPEMPVMPDYKAQILALEAKIKKELDRAYNLEVKIKKVNAKIEHLENMIDRCQD